MDLRAGASIVGVLAVIYRLTVAFGPRAHQDAGVWRRSTTVGAIVLLVAIGLLVAFGDRVHRDAQFWDALAIWARLVVLAVFVWCLVISFVRWLGSTSDPPGVGPSAWGTEAG